MTAVGSVWNRYVTREESVRARVEYENGLGSDPSQMPNLSAIRIFVKIDLAR